MEQIEFNSDGTVRLPQPDDIIETDKDAALGSYVLMFAVWAVGLPIPFLSIIASIIYYYINKKESRFVNFHLYQALIIQWLLTVVNVALIVWLIIMIINNFAGYKPFLVFAAFTVVWNLFFVIYSIFACLRAKAGRFCYMPFFGKMIFEKYYGREARTYEKKKIENRPPAGF